MKEMVNPTTEWRCHKFISSYWQCIECQSSSELNINRACHLSLQLSCVLFHLIILGCRRSTITCLKYAFKETTVQQVPIVLADTMNTIMVTHQWNPIRILFRFFTICSQRGWVHPQNCFKWWNINRRKQSTGKLSEYLFIFIKEMEMIKVSLFICRWYYVGWRAVKLKDESHFKSWETGWDQK